MVGYIAAGVTAAAVGLFIFLLFPEPHGGRRHRRMTTCSWYARPAKQRRH